MLFRFRVGELELVGIVDVEHRRWKWGAERWSWPWLAVGSA